MGRRKPSMFSKNYEKQMKKIKRRKYIILILACAFLVGAIIFLSTPIKDKVANIVKSNINVSKDENKDENKDDVVKENDDSNKNVSKEDSPQNEKELIKDVLIEGKKLKLKLDSKKEKIISFEGIESLKGDVSPNGKNIVILNKDSQNMYLVDWNGNIKDVTQKEYISDENISFSKDKVISENQDYIWADNPKFINNNLIAYTSYLPWVISEKNQYIWTLDINSLNRNPHYEIYGKNIKMGNIQEKGLVINIDDKVLFIDSQGNIIY
ncbi:hypothetical protein UT300019_16910 [Clostridium sp. CTA-19]